ncbi:MAG: fibronectin type III domain-containing protein [Prosthecobacter sp.]|jgi:hypothetical protein|uniref:fibronectin type III domain-containing protein n=1 Tax=Prosthecobacter sp. TaxID=1965333 RepID=UPI0019D9F8D4|nr:fibronectin type III domain-containing protein [Prosthecobacter sp.]MBE2283237.1 fibronectin type III domain-containing protein [Prosthecobacter sp.]
MTPFILRLVCLLAFAAGSLAHAVELIGKPEVMPAASSAVIQWRTDVDCGTRLQYGLSPTTLDRKTEGAVSSNHEVTLQGLTPGTTYYYSIGSARTRLAGGSFITPAEATQPSLVRRVLDAIVPEKQAGTVAAKAKAPPARETWGNITTLQDHFERHGGDFGSKSADDYAAEAWFFLQRARSDSLPMKLDATDGTLRVFDPKTGAFAAYTGSGRTKTFFKPDSPTYWQRQPGRAVKPSELRFMTR